MGELSRALRGQARARIRWRLASSRATLLRGFNPLSCQSQLRAATGPDERMTVALSLFGPPVVTKAGELTRGRAVQRRRLAILAILAASRGRPVSRDRILGLLWPDADTAQARKLLSEALYVIRREFGEGILITSGDDIELSTSSVDCDLWQFRILRDAGDARGAASVCSAPFLDGWYVEDAIEFERWMEAQRASLARELEVVLLQVAEDARLGGEFVVAADAWRRLVALDPHRTSHAMGLARTLAASGETGAALAAIGDHERRLRDDLELAADASLLAFGEELRRRRSPGSASRLVPAEPGGPDLGDTSPSVARSVDASAPPLAPAKRSRRMVRALVAAGLVLITAMVAWTAREPAPPAAERAPQRLAVLYLRDGSSTQDLGALADNLTEDLIEQFVGSSGFEVIPVNTAKRLREEVPGTDDLLRATGATMVLDGRMLREGERIVVRLQLREVASGAVIAAMTFERTPERLASLGDDVARDVAMQMRTRIGQDVRLRDAKRGTSNLRASVLVTRGNRARDEAAALLKTGVASDRNSVQRLLTLADSLYQQAEAEDRSWPRPGIERGWTALAMARLREGKERAERLSAAIVEVERRLRRHPEEPALLELRAALLWTRIKAEGVQGDDALVTAAVADLERALAIDSLRPRSWATLSSIHWVRGDAGRAMLAARRALDLDWYYEEAPATIRSLISSSILRQQLDSASAWCARGRLHYPLDWQFTECELTVMKYSVDARPDPARAWRLVQRLDSLDPPAGASAAGHAYAPTYRRLIAAMMSGRAGDTASVRAELSRARLGVRGDPDLELDLAPDEAVMLLMLGDSLAARSRVDHAMARRPVLRSLLAVDPLLRTLVATPDGARGGARTH